MSEKIINIYRFNSKGDNISYIYSLKNPKDYLSFQYYILTNNEDQEPIIYEASNTIKILQSNNINLIPITKEDPEYKIFLSKLLSAINKKSKKEEVLSRK